MNVTGAPFRLVRRVLLPGGQAMREYYATDVTPEEKEFGFAVTETRSGDRAALVELGDGLRAVKLRLPDSTNGGGVAYVVCDAFLQPLYRPATTVQDLKRRFPSSPPPPLER